MRFWNLRNPALYLALLGCFALAAGADAMRPPQQQISVRIFASSVHGYRQLVHPYTTRYVRCRYRPTCSDYSLQVVGKYGIWKGGRLAFRRILSCRKSVPYGTYDPVP